MLAILSHQLRFAKALQAIKHLLGQQLQVIVLQRQHITTHRRCWSLRQDSVSQSELNVKPAIFPYQLMALTMHAMESLMQVVKAACHATMFAFR